ncbi:hypothetical protein C8Q79DRAFT_1000650 [Trametes meyenii]|nr:hypothetical protein C8Q79DRAFT_1000650 [Trametes meyenii]
MASSSSSGTRPLNRGAACLPCRKLKARCDGNKPACGRCLANGRPDDCEYAVGGEVTRSRLLEENIALLEARIKELENPSEPRSVRLHDPRGQEAAGSSSSRAIIPESLNMQLSPPGMPQSTGGSSPTPQEIQALVQSFMAHASQLGLFLNPTKFLQALSLPRGVPGAADDALANTVYLWGSRLSSLSTLRSMEVYLASVAVQAASGATFVTQSAASAQAGVLYKVQTEVLLANYFLSNGRLLEGKYHGLAAVALVTGSRLHQLDVVKLAAGGANSVTIGENIHAFWAVFALDKMWAAALNMPPSIAQRGRSGIPVTTPWPLAIETYEQGIVIPRRGYTYSVHDFCRGSVNDSGEEFSRPALRVKAAALYDSALYVSSTYRPDLPNPGEFNAQFTTLDNSIERFHRQLSGVRNRSLDDMREVLVARTLTCVAAIQLHSVFVNHQPVSRQKSLAVAIASVKALDVVDINQYRYLDPIIAILWSTVSNVFLEEMRRFRRSTVSVRQEDMARISTSLDRVMAAMSTLASHSHLMASKLGEIQQARASLN